MLAFTLSEYPRKDGLRRDLERSGGEIRVMKVIIWVTFSNYKALSSLLATIGLRKSSGLETSSELFCLRKKKKKPRTELKVWVTGVNP